MFPGESGTSKNFNFMTRLPDDYYILFCEWKENVDSLKKIRDFLNDLGWKKDVSGKYCKESFEMQSIKIGCVNKIISEIEFCDVNFDFNAVEEFVKKMLEDGSVKSLKIKGERIRKTQESYIDFLKKYNDYWKTESLEELKELK